MKLRKVKPRNTQEVISELHGIMRDYSAKEAEHYARLVSWQVEKHFLDFRESLQASFKPKYYGQV